ncbi:hypothetical protein K2V61_01385 [Staphylococcus simulans]|uniref:hypothetical protein n=1 Tax=Staphylococcus simulans TaxID=1286 RepID=UPI001E649521|nr:hypothetical protein [Staphylococcus simulans]MCD8914211.1 hypothetical protein [Staphylococcus simulans]
MKKWLVILASSLLFVTACGNNSEKEEKANKDKEEKTEKSSDSQSKDKTKDKKKDNEPAKEKSSDNQDEKQSQNSQEESNNQTNETPPANQINLGNITDRKTLESVIYGNYSEVEKIQAYNSAVANGVIPQGNVTEGPASAAYQSSLNVESGAEQSVYNQQQNTQTEEAPQEDVNAEINAAQTEEEYIDALRKKYNGGLSSAEIQTKHAIEQGYYDGSEEEQQEIYDEIQRREADIEAGKYDQYKQ